MKAHLHWLNSNKLSKDVWKLAIDRDNYFRKITSSIMKIKIYENLSLKLLALGKFFFFLNECFRQDLISSQ